MTSQTRLVQMFRGFRSVIYKETIHILRDPKTLMLVLMIPAFELIIFGYAIDLDVRNIPTVVYNLDGRAQSRELIRAFTNTGTFHVIRTVTSDEDMNRTIIRGDAEVGVKIPPNYTDCVATGRPARFLTVVDGSNSTVAMQALNVGNAIALRESVKTFLASQLGANAMPVEMRSRVEFNPDMKTVNFMVPGIVAILLQVVIMLLTALSIVREREQGTLEQLMVTPIARTGLVFGKLAPYGEVGVFQSFVIFTLMYLMFGVPIAGSYTLLAALTLIFIFTALSLGLFISTYATNQLQALQMSVFVILPSVLLSGFIFPQASMPSIIYWFAQFIPATYYIRILRGIVLRGAGLAELWPQALILTALGLTAATASALRFRKNIN